MLAEIAIWIVDKVTIPNTNVFAMLSKKAIQGAHVYLLGDEEMTRENCWLFLKSLQRGESIRTSTDEGLRIFLTSFFLKNFKQSSGLASQNYPSFLEHSKFGFVFQELPCKLSSSYNNCSRLFLIFLTSMLW